VKAIESKPEILVVDDIPSNILLLSRLLKNLYRVLAADSGEKALEMAASKPSPDLILLDIRMPKMDGFEVCRRLKADPSLADIPVIFLTASNLVEDETKGLELGAVDFITKPFNHHVVLARVKTHLILKKAREVLEEKNQLMTNNLEAAARIQETLLPKHSPSRDRLKFSYRFQPCEMVGGDLFNFFPLGEKYLGFFILDVAGHGLPAAMITFSISQIMQPSSEALIDLISHPAVVQSPTQVIKRLAEAFPFERFNSCFTIAYLVLDLETGTLVSCSAGHPYPMILRRDGSITTLSEGGPLIGIGVHKFRESMEKLEPGDRLFLYTDGLTEFRNSSREFFGLDRVIEVLKSGTKETLEANFERMMNTLRDFSGSEKPADDITFWGFDYEKPLARPR